MTTTCTHYAGQCDQLVCGRDVERATADRAEAERLDRARYSLPFARSHRDQLAMGVKGS